MELSVVDYADGTRLPIWDDTSTDPHQLRRISLSHTSRILSYFPDKVMLVEYRRSSKEFHQALLGEPLLHQYHSHIANCSSKEPKMLLQSHVLDATKAVLGKGVLFNGETLFLKDLKARYIICGTFSYLVTQDLIRMLPSRLCLTIKHEMCLL